MLHFHIIYNWITFVWVTLKTVIFSFSRGQVSLECSHLWHIFLVSENLLCSLYFPPHNNMMCDSSVILSSIYPASYILITILLTVFWVLSLTSPRLFCSNPSVLLNPFPFCHPGPLPPVLCVYGSVSGFASGGFWFCDSLAFPVFMDRCADTGTLPAPHHAVFPQSPETTAMVIWCSTPDSQLPCMVFRGWSA